jgi:CheY-like chemotaxis protein
MAKARVLLADNDKDYLETLRDILQRDGFQILPAINPTEAKSILDRGGVDLAVLDIRLLNDEDEKDLSGLLLAKYTAPHIPKIVLTRWPTWELVRDSLQHQLEDLPSAVEFVAKQEGAQALLTNIKKTLNLVTRFRETSDNLAQKISQWYNDARQQSKWYFTVSLIAAVIGMAVIFLSVYLAVNAKGSVAISSAIVGIIAEGVSLLFFRRVDAANGRMDVLHRELMELRWLDTLIAACEDLTSEERQESAKERVINSAAAMWLGSAHLNKQEMGVSK